ncbi:hypothetical protein PENSUB_9387 [Penicillium subrubescens]|uniref:Uncharacterized protein n=1 Tax=Penicillium subrubescens TaxID=1316194 RepID=A0A1Q5TDK4_9EURO|nr:hypothetical protein PENSUB_9387 [Penicillium subrubescens]
MAPRHLSSRPRIMPDRSMDHNITREPRVSSIPTVNPNGIFGNRARETESLSSHTETGSVREMPARRGVNIFGQMENSNATILGEDDGQDDNEDEDGDDDEDENEDEAEEEPVDDGFSSPDPIDDRALQNNLNTLKLKLQGLSREIYSYELARDPGTRLHHIYQETKKLSEFKDQETRIVGFIGETGAEADFMNEDEVNDLLEELLQSIRRATIQTDRSLIAEENWEQYEIIGRRSHETLQAIFRNRSDLTIEYLSRPEAELEIRQELKELAMDRLTFRPGGSSSLQYSVVAGLRDTNHARVRATERYLASTCDEVFIVAGILRCVSNESIYETIKKCGTTKRIRIEISPEESARGTGHFAGHVKKMNAAIKKLETEANRIGRQRQRAQGTEKAKLAVLESTIE